MNKKEKLTEATMLALEGKLTENEKTNYFYNNSGGEESEKYQLANYDCGYNDTCAFGTPNALANNIEDLIANTDGQESACNEIRQAIDLCCKNVKYILYTMDNGYYNYIYEIDENGNEIKLLVKWIAD